MDNNLAVNVYKVKSIEAPHLVCVIKDTLLRLNLSISKVRGQCYDGASNMQGIRNRVAKLIQDEEPRDTFIHWYGHSLNLAAKDTIQICKILKSSLETTFEITKLVKYSPRRENLFNDIKEEIAWVTWHMITVPYTMDGMCRCHAKYNYKVLQELWEQAADVARDTETIARIQGVANNQMKTFEYFLLLIVW